MWCACVCVCVLGTIGGVSGSVYIYFAPPIPPIHPPHTQRHAHHHRRRSTTTAAASDPFGGGGHNPTTTSSTTTNKHALPLWPRLVAEIAALDRRLATPQSTSATRTWGQATLCRLCAMVLQRVARSSGGASLFAPQTMRAVVKASECSCFFFVLMS